MTPPRQAFGLPPLDAILGGGLLPGTLTVVAGATGIGKTQLGLRWADAGLTAEGRRGVVCDLTSRGDAQNHANYARDQLGWDLETYPGDLPPDLDRLWDDEAVGEYLHPFARAGRRVTRRDMDPDAWHAWKVDLARTLRGSAAFFYRHFVAGSRRVVVDGIEPAERASESIQFEFFEYLYQNVLRKDDAWAAREILRERYRAREAEVAAHPYPQGEIGCLYLSTTPQVLLDDLMARPIAEGDVFANANTILLLGKTRTERGMGRALFVAKHRGSACGEEILPYRMTDRGPEFLPGP